MKLKRAIKILEEQKQKVLSSDHPNNEEWIFETASYIKEFFGINSTEYSWISQFKWHVKYIDSPFIDNEKDVDFELKQKPKKAVTFLENCKNVLKNKGLYKEPKKNLLSDFNNWKLITIFIAIFIAGLTSGIWLNEKKSFSFNSFIQNNTKDNTNSKREITESEQKKPVNNNHTIKD